MKNTKQAKFNLPKTSCFPDDHTSIKDSNHQSAESIGSNNDLLTEILHRLPAKSILRFKSVSKQWLSLLTHPRFTLMFDKLLKTSGLYCNELPVSFDVENPTTPPFSMVDFHPHIRTLDVVPGLFPHTRGIKILQYSNGLLLCFFVTYGRYYVFNPTTRKLSVIPPIIEPDVRIYFMGLAYHPTECVHYKLVCVCNENGQRMYNIQIYSSKTGTWKKINQTLTPFKDTEFKCGVYWNGGFYWAPFCDNPKYLRLDNEDIQDLPLPPPSPVRVSAYGYEFPVNPPLYFGESCGHLHLVDRVDYKNRLNMNVYEMLRDHSGWFIKYQLDLSELSVAYPNMNKYQRDLNELYAGYPYRDKYDFGVLDVVRGEEEEGTFMVVKALDNIKRYHILDQSFKQLFSIPNNKGVRYVNAHRYIEKIGSF